VREETEQHVVNLEQLLSVRSNLPIDEGENLIGAIRRLRGAARDGLEQSLVKTLLFVMWQNDPTPVQCRDPQVNLGQICLQFSDGRSNKQPSDPHFTQNLHNCRKTNAKPRLEFVRAITTFMVERIKLVLVGDSGVGTDLKNLLINEREDALKPPGNRYCC
jgi:hypothetical protein